MRGHVRKRSKNSWTVVVELPRDPVTNKRRQKWVTVKGTKKDAERELARLINEIEKGTYVEPHKMTFTELTQKWFDVHVSANLRENTQENYKTVLRTHIIPEIGHINIGELKTLHLQELCARKLKEGYSNRTVRYIISLVKEILNFGVQMQLIPKNVAESVKLPRNETKEKITWTAEEIWKFLDVAERKSRRLYALFFMALTTGMRREELLGLRWEDVDLDEGVAFVRQTLVVINGRLKFDEPKTEKSKRAVALSPKTVEELRKHRVLQLQEKLKLGPAYKDHGLVFCTKDGKPLRPDNVAGRLFRSLIKKAGVPRIRFHDLRHTHATLMLEAGEHPKITAARLGHADTKTLMETYTHLVPRVQKEAAKNVDKLLIDKKTHPGDNVIQGG
ncbi:tyrosine-type recombinase/integrase [Desulfofundulus sp.]|uniref:tyrosine-type recombinase/integrase n=1 Tax=Desulfofundulus sp. TaxID=2282750 RepID=UPI003C714D0E